MRRYAVHRQRTREHCELPESKVIRMAQRGDEGAFERRYRLHSARGYAHSEIANLLGCSVGNAKSQLHKARVRLRKLLRPEMSSNELRKGTSGPPAEDARELESQPFLPSTELCQTV